MKIDINEIIQMEQRRGEINNTPFEEIEWFEGDNPINIPQDRIDDWKFIGLSNIYFISTNYYKGNKE